MSFKFLTRNEQLIILGLNYQTTPTNLIKIMKKSNFMRTTTDDRSTYSYTLISLRNLIDKRMVKKLGTKSSRTYALTHTGTLARRVIKRMNECKNVDLQ